jgi:hypothetical protein
VSAGLERVIVLRGVKWEDVMGEWIFDRVVDTCSSRGHRSVPTRTDEASNHRNYRDAEGLRCVGTGRSCSPVR